MRTTFTSYALLGSGRLARHLQFYLQSLGLPFTQWERVHGLKRLHTTVAGASHVLLAVSDRAIEGLTRSFSGEAKTLVHFSGASRVQGVWAAHPLMTFAPELKPADWYRTIPFVHDRGAEFAELLPGFPNPHFALDAELRPLYHALVSLAGNSSFLLWQNAGNAFEQQLGLPRALLAPFLHQVVDNAVHGTMNGFTGPVARGDWKTVAAHIQALQQSELSKAYQDYLQSARSAGHAVPKELL